MRRDHVTWQNRRPYHFRQQWIESDEILLADDRQGPVRRERVLQVLSAAHTGKPAADDDQILVAGSALLHLHGLPPDQVGVAVRITHDHGRMKAQRAVRRRYFAGR